MADHKKELNRILRQQEIANQEAETASRLSEKVEKATGGAIRAANPNYRLAGSSMPYSTTHSAAGRDKYGYLTGDLARRILSGEDVTASNHNIWGQITSPNPYKTTPQYIIEQVMGLKTGDVLLATDIEALGSPSFMADKNVSFFSPTQLAIVPYSVDLGNPDGVLKKINGEPINILISPDKNSQKALSDLIDRVEASAGVPNLSSDEYRSLKDLIAYAGDAKFGADGMGIIQSTNSKALINGTNLKNYVAEMRQGLFNLQNKGMARTQVPSFINKKMLTGGYKLGNESFKFLTYNGLSYDMPALKEVFGDAKFIKNASGHIDLYETMRQAYGDLWGQYYKGKLDPREAIRGAGRLENIFRGVFGMSMDKAGYTAHVGLSDVYATGDVASKELGRLIQTIRGGHHDGGHNIMGLYGGVSTSVQFQDTALQNGAQLFARTSSYRGSPLDAVIDINNQKNPVRNFNRATYKNRLYTLTSQWEKEAEGKKYYGVTLYNVDDDLYHTLARESKEELQAAIQNDFTPYSKKMPGYAEVAKYRTQDAARREYESIFVGDGSAGKAQKYVDAIDSMKKKLNGKELHTLSQKEFNDLVSSETFGLTRKQADHMKQFYKRLSLESDIIGNFVGVGNSEGQLAGLNDTQKDLAMTNLRREMDTHFGVKTKNLSLPSMMSQVQLFNPRTGVRTGIDATRMDTLERGIRSLITGGVKENNLNFSNVVDNFSHVVADLVGNGSISVSEASQIIEEANHFMADPRGPTKGVQFLSRMLAANVNGKLRRQQTIEGVTSLTATNHIVLGKASFDQSTVFGRAIENARNMAIYSDKGLFLPKETRAAIDRFHSGKAKSLQRQLGIPNTLLPKTVSEDLDMLASSLHKQGIFMNVYLDKGNQRGMTLALFAKEHSENVIKNGLDSDKIVKAYIPLAENDILTTNGLSRINSLFAVPGRDGKVKVSTAQNQIFYKMGYGDRAKELAGFIKAENYREANRHINKAINSALNPLSSASRYAIDQLDDELVSSSRGANWIRSGYINISPLIDNVLKEQKAGKRFEDLTLNETNDLLRGVLYNDVSYDGDFAEYGRAVRNRLKGDLGLDYGVSSVKSELLVRGVVGLNDPRQLATFGMFNTMTRENLRQAQNYTSMSTIAAYEPGKGWQKRGPSALRVNPIIMTNEAAEVYGDEVTGLAVRTARMNDEMIKKFVGSGWNDIPEYMRPSTYESMAVMKESVAKNFVTTRQIRQRIDAGSGLTPSEIISHRLQNGGEFFIGQEGITLGRVMKDSMDNNLAQSAFDYKPKGPGAWLRAMKPLDDGGYEFIIDEIVDVKEGTKLISDTGKKATLRVVSDENWSKWFGKLGDTDMIWGGEAYGAAKETAETLSSALRYGIEEYKKAQGYYGEEGRVTVGKMKKLEIENQITEVIRDMLGVDKKTAKEMRFQNMMINGNEHSVFLMPGNYDVGKLTYSNVDKALQRLGVNVTQNGIDMGISVMRVASVENYADAIGSLANERFDGIRYGLREMEMIRMRRNAYKDAGLNIDALYQAMQENVVDVNKGDARKIAQAKSISNVLRYANNQNIGDDITTYFSTGYAPTGANQRLIGDLKDLPIRSGGYYSADLAGTILDRNLSDGKGFILKLPTDVKVGNGYVDSVFMAYTDPNYIKDGTIQLNQLQSKQLAIWRESQEYTRGIAEGGLEGAARANQAMGSLERLVNSYITEAGDQLMGSQGYVASDILASNMKHSGRFVARGFNAADWSPAKEGYTMVSEKRMRQMLGGFDDKAVNQMIDLIGGNSAKAGGIDSLVGMLKNSDAALPMLINRYPTISRGSVLPTMVKIAGDSNMDDGIMVTVGTAARLAGDFDGDYMSLAMPYYGGKKAANLNAEAFKQLQGMFKEEQKVNVVAGKYILDKYTSSGEGVSMQTVLEKIADGSDNRYVDEIRKQMGGDYALLEIESRLQKTIGPFSNLSLKYRRGAELVGRYTGDDQLYDVISAVGATIEQKAAISSKKLEDEIRKWREQGLSEADIDIRRSERVASQKNLRTALERFAPEDIVKNLESMGMIKDGALDGIEGVTLGGGKYTVGKAEILSAFEKMHDAFGDRNSPMYQAYFTVFASEPKDAASALLMDSAIYNTGAKDYLDTPNINALRDVLGINLDEDTIKSHFTRKMSSNYYSDKIGGEVNDVLTHAAKQTVGGETARGAMGSISDILEGVGKSNVAMFGLAGLGLWAASAMMRGPRTEHQPVEAHADQAPSSDGTYVNPSMFAGAPAGAGPTAMVSSRGSGYERINVNIKGNIGNGMTNQEISQIISDEIRRQSGIDMNLKITSEDNRQTIDRQWLQTQFANALKTGYVY